MGNAFYFTWKVSSLRRWPVTYHKKAKWNSQPGQRLLPENVQQAISLKSNNKLLQQKIKNSGINVTLKDIANMKQNGKLASKKQYWINCKLPENKRRNFSCRGTYLRACLFGANVLQTFDGPSLKIELFQHSESLVFLSFVPLTSSPETFLLYLTLNVELLCKEH